MKRMDRDTGGKRRGRKKGGKIVRLAAVVWLLCVLSGRKRCARGTGSDRTHSLYRPWPDARGLQMRIHLPGQGKHW